MQTFVQFFSKLVAPHLPPLMAQAWHLFLASQPVYQHLVIDNTPDLDADQVSAPENPCSHRSSRNPLFQLAVLRLVRNVACVVPG